MRFIAHTTNPLDGDSVAGVLSAIKAGFAGADVNVHSTADGVIVALHWAAGGGWPLYPRADALTFAQCQARRNTRATPPGWPIRLVPKCRLPRAHGRPCVRPAGDMRRVLAPEYLRKVAPGNVTGL